MVRRRRAEPHVEGGVLRRLQPGRCRPAASTSRSPTRPSRRLGSGLGAAGFVVYDDTADMVAVAAELTRFLAVESCGQCPPCKRGSMELTEILTRIAHGGGSDGDLGHDRGAARDR